MEQLREAATQLPVHNMFETSGLEQCDEPRRLWQVGDALGEVAVCGAIGQETSDEGNDLAEVDPVAEANQRVVRHADIEEADSTVRSDDAVEFGEERRKVHEVAKRKAAGHAVDARVGNGQLQDVGLNPRSFTSASMQHPVRQVDRNRRQPCVSKIDAHVARSTRQVEHDAVLWQTECLEGNLPPAHVEPERHDAVDEVVARGNLVEHVLHCSALCVSLQEALGVPRGAVVSAIPSHEGRLRPEHAFGADRGAW